jgi:uncharacterized membrane protein
MTTRPTDSSTDESLAEPHAPVGWTTKPDAGRGKRIAAAVLGGALVALGLRRRSLGGAAAALAGGWLLYRGVSKQTTERRTGTSTEQPAGTTTESGTATTPQSTGTASQPTATTPVERSITVGKPADELHRLWRDSETLTQIVGHFAEVTDAGEDRQHWRVDGPLGWSAEWDAEIVEDSSGESLRWESVEDGALLREGSVRFRPAPGDRGTEVTLRLQFDPPGGALGSTVLERLGFVPATLANEALGRFKSLAETGEIPTLERNPSGRGSGDLL